MSNLDVSKSVRDYFTKILSEVQGMKILLVDEETTGIISMVYTQSQILEHEVYLVDRIDGARERMPHLKCISFLRPTADNIQYLVKELSNPNYGEYNLLFSNEITNQKIDELAAADMHCVVKQVSEYYADFYAISPELYSLDMHDTMELYEDRYDSATREKLNRIADGICASLLALKRTPVIRYAKHSGFCEKLAHAIEKNISKNGSLFHFAKRDVPCVLLLVDRRDDPVTPLLNQWTYQAQLHEIIGMDKNKLDMSHVPDMHKNLKQIVLSVETDNFYRSHRFDNYGDLCASVKELVDKYADTHQQTTNLQTIADMKRFVESYGEFSAQSTQVSKHVALMSEISRQVERYRLLDISEVEQALACSQDHSNAVKQINELLASTVVRMSDKIRVVLLYNLRYENHGSNCLSQFLEKLQNMNVPDEDFKLPTDMTLHCGTARRHGDLFQNSSIFKRVRKNVKSSVKGVENIYTQHEPPLATTVQDLVKGRLKDLLYPAINSSVNTKAQVNDVLVFQVGGTTYEEADRKERRVGKECRSRWSPYH
eukprot:TRINITY_DN3202_c0_g1_i1.p1 TRINITY_DN3202_c0_g1~~TRINITY_DN3202_c0_g1_i1.p1  ORF type:complete len:542 (+),score=121.11 TRINITY_DN3202_c0_g1_i1:105-1730(+)